MKVNVDRRTLNDALGVVGRVINSRAVIPVLHGFYIATCADCLEVYGTDLMTAIRVRIPAEVVEPGKTVVIAETLAPLVKQSVGETVTLETRRNKIEVTCGSTEGQISIFDPDEYPPLSIFDSPFTTLPAKGLQRAIAQAVVGVTYPNVARPSLENVCVYNDGSKLILYGADGFRATQVSIEPGSRISGLGNGKYLLVPYKSIVELGRLLGASGLSDDDLVEVHLHKNQLLFDLGDQQFSVTLADTEAYPAVWDIFSRYQGGSTSVTFDRSALIRACGLASIFGEHTRFDVEGDVVTAKSAWDEAEGSSQTVLDARVTGEGNSFAVSNVYLRDFLKTVNVAEITIEYDNNSPLMIAVENCKHIIMPLYV